MHVYTPRYRLRHFEEVTGRSLESTETIVEVSVGPDVTAHTA